MRNEKIYTKIQNDIVELLEGMKLGKFKKPWFGLNAEYAHNPHSKNVYTGFNQFYLSIVLMLKGYESNKWLTFKQIKELKGNVKKGTKSTQITYYQKTYKKNGKPVSPEFVRNLCFKTGQTAAELGFEESAFVKFFNVFNVAQIENLPTEFYEVKEIILNENERIEKAELLVLNTGVKIKNVEGNSAHYNCLTEDIIMPLIGQFENTEAYYNVLFHELSHWSGDKKRLDRDMTGGFKTKEYAFEELVAEFSAALICGSIGINAPITNNATYINSWLKAFKSDVKVFFKAAALSQKAADYILNHSLKAVAA